MTSLSFTEPPVLRSGLSYQHSFYTPDLVRSRHDLPPNAIFVFGANPEGRHWKGAALTANKHFDAVVGQGEGLQGRSFAIVTKELRYDHPAITLAQVEQGIRAMLVCAWQNPGLLFYVTKIGTQLAYFTETQIGDIFRVHMPLIPSNVILPQSFT
jgi:hypothetical protein